MKNDYILAGILVLSNNGEEDDILCLSHGDPLAEELSFLSQKFCTVRYYISDKELTVEEAQEEHLKQIIGSVSADYGMSYTETTGYLWTTENLMVGGHDLLNEFKSHIGKYLILMVTVDDENEKLKELNRQYGILISQISMLDSYANERKMSRNEVLEMYDSGEIKNLIKDLNERIKR